MKPDARAYFYLGKAYAQLKDARSVKALREAVTRDADSEDAWELLDRLTRVYMAPDATFPAPRAAGHIVRYTVEKVGGVGPWAA